MTEYELEVLAEKLADKVSKKILITLTPEQHYDQHVYIKSKQETERLNSSSTRHVIEKVLGTLAAASILGFVTWLGHITINAFLGK